MESNEFDSEAARRRYDAPYTSKHQIPTIQRYREHRKEIKQEEGAQNEEASEEFQDETSKTKKATGAVKDVFGLDTTEHLPGEVYATQNRNIQGSQAENHDQESPPPVPDKDDGKNNQDQTTNEKSPPVPQKDDRDSKQKQSKGKQGQSAAEAVAGLSDPKAKRNAVKHSKHQDGGREVTDPITHLPIVIHDLTSKDLKKAPENEPAAGTEPRTFTGFSGATKSESQLKLETEEGQQGLQAMERLYPPPDYETVQESLVRVYRFALAVGLGSILVLVILVLSGLQLLQIRGDSIDRKGPETGRWTRVFVPMFLMISLSSAAGGALIWAIQGWLGKKVEHIWEDEIWDASRDAEHEQIKSSTIPESTQWLNMLLASVWPLINPDLFTSLADTLEDTMQASLPKMVRMVSVDDLGQGSEALRILGVRWLPTGAAARSVNKDGKLKPTESQEHSDRTDPSTGKIEHDDGGDGDGNSNSEKNINKKTAEQDQENIAEGMEAEQGDFVNVEVAFAYRARSSSRSLRTKANNAHLLIRFFLPGNVALPVWVEMRGIVGTMRLRLQLTPDPPFFALATLTFMGQPKADLSCVPLSRHSLNIMDLPLISTFVQSSIDAALAEYVAPKSLTLDLKQMLAGDDFKKDTSARGIIMVRIIKAYDFKEGDGNIGPFKKGSSDPYCTVSWGKFGKSIFSTRIILDEMKPTWDEWAAILVGPEELNAEEILRVQLWDSDRMTADDNLGKVELSLKEVMTKDKTKGKMMDRKDGFSGDEKGEKMPGTLEWSVGYFSKTRITPDQLARQSAEPEIRTVENLKTKVSENAERKLREATAHDESKEISQQKAQDYHEREASLIISSPPSDDHPSGILSVQIHQITGLELEQINKSRPKQGSRDDSDTEDEGSDDLPSAYCTIILNHVKIYKTRTKPKNAKPFFNAGTERFIRDWRTAEVMISARDSRVHENDPLLGIIYLPLAKIFQTRSQVMDTFPLAGGVGYGRARISLVFRSVQLQLPRELIGWDYGTLEIKSDIKASNLPSNLQNLRLRLNTGVAHGKMRASDNSTSWEPKRGRSSLCLAVKGRYSTPLVVEFRKSSVGPDSSPAWAVFWLKDIPDDEEKTVKLPVFSSKSDIKRGKTCCDYIKQEKPIGEIEVTLRFWRGLSGYHKGLASKGKQEDLKDVMEVLDTINDIYQGDDAMSENGDTNHDNLSTLEPESDNGFSTPSSDTDSDKENSANPASFVKGKVRRFIDGNQDSSSDGSRGPLEQARDYRSHRKQLHRQHRGLMQWKAVRSVDWAKNKVENARYGLFDKFKHSERMPGVETEV